MPSIRNLNLNNINIKGTPKMHEKFEIMPLDINLEKIQKKLKKRCEFEVPEYGDFAPVVEEYTNKDSSLDLGDVKVVCRKPPKDIEDHNKKRFLEVVANNRARTKEYSSIILSGTKEELMKKLETPGYFLQFKKAVLELADN